MKIRIEYDGTMAKCYIQDTFGKDPFKEVPFNEADKMSQIFALNSFRCIKECWKRNQKKPNHLDRYKDFIGRRKEKDEKS